MKNITILVNIDEVISRIVSGETSIECGDIEMANHVMAKLFINSWKSPEKKNAPKVEKEIVDKHLLKDAEEKSADEISIEELLAEDDVAKMLQEAEDARLEAENLIDYVYTISIQEPEKLKLYPGEYDLVNPLSEQLREQWIISTRDETYVIQIKNSAA